MQDIFWTFNLRPVSTRLEQSPNKKLHCWKLGQLCTLHACSYKNYFESYTDQVSTERQNVFVYEIHCTNCQAVYLSEFQRLLKSKSNEYVMSCAIWYYLYNIACKFTKSDTPPWLFFTFFKLCKWYQIMQSITYEICRELWHQKQWEKLLRKRLQLWLG